MNTTFAETQPVNEPAEAPSLSPRRALLIEDNALDARLIEIMLNEAGNGQFELERAERLAEGLELLGKGQIDIVLLDLSLPDSGGGLATFHRAHAQAPHVPIIVMTGLDDETVAVNAVQQGAQDYLVKGQVTGPLLVRAMRYALERKRTAEQLAHYAEALRERNAQMEADFNMAREIQQVFLPSQYPTFPRGVTPAQSALQFFHRYFPAAAVGGDFFNIFSITDSIAAVFICDVMGHGMRAALVTAIMRGLVEELLPLAMDPGKFLAELNRSLYAILERTDEPILATAFYLIADVEEGELRFSNAGHPSPFCVRRDVGLAEPLKLYCPQHGPALGLFEQSTYPNCRCPIAKDDLIVLFTDGLYEVPGRTQEEYGQDRLLAAVRERVRLPANDLFDQLLGEVQAFGAKKEFEDDVCLVGLEVARLGAVRPRGGVS